MMITSQLNGRPSGWNLLSGAGDPHLLSSLGSQRQRP
jgi:hypothetical protein